MEPFARLRLPADDASAPLGPALAERFAAAHGLAGLDAGRLAAVVGGLMAFVRDRAYPGAEEGELGLELSLTAQDAHVTVEDWGEPVAEFGAESGPVPAELTAAVPQALDVRLRNLGREGKRLSARLALLHPPAVDHRAAPVAAAAARAELSAAEIEVHDARPDEVAPISRLLYSTYGLNYGHPDFYRPRWLAARIADGSVRSTVAVHGGRVVGHHALLVEDGVTSAESGVAAVDPAYRGLGIFERLFAHTIERARGLGLDAVYGRAVTVHPYSQRAEAKQGYREAALLLGAVPPWMAMREIAGAEPGRRTASLVSHLVLRPCPRPVTLPLRYAEALTRTYEHLGLTAVPGTGVGSGGPAVTYDDDDVRATGRLTVHRWDPGTEAELHAALRHVIVHHDDVVYADVDLHGVVDPEPVIAMLGDRSFFYAGLVPFGPGGHDFLRLQRVNAENVETEHVVVDSPFARRLLADILADRRRVEPGPD